MKKATQAAATRRSHGKHHSIEDSSQQLNKPLTEEQQPDLRELPMLPVRNTVLIPNLIVPLLVGREHSLKAIEEAMSKDRTIFVVTQLDEDMEDAGPDDVYTIGVEAVIERLLKMPDGSVSALIRGQQRLRRIAYTQKSPFMRVRVETVEDEGEQTLAVEALKRAVLVLFEKCSKLSHTLPDEAYITAM